jgi:hypothetical protein
MSFVCAPSVVGSPVKRQRENERYDSKNCACRHANSGRDLDRYVAFVDERQRPREQAEQRGEAR